MNNIIIHNYAYHSSHHVILALLGTLIALELAAINNFIEIAADLPQVLPED